MRSFLLKVAETHIPKCENAKSRPKPPPTRDQLEKQVRDRRQMHLHALSPRHGLRARAAAAVGDVTPQGQSKNKVEIPSIPQSPKRNDQRDESPKPKQEAS